jgi:hypothetical protein
VSAGLNSGGLWWADWEWLEICGGEGLGHLASSWSLAQGVLRHDLETSQWGGPGLITSCCAIGWITFRAEGGSVIQKFCVKWKRYLASSELWEARRLWQLCFIVNFIKNISVVFNKNLFRSDFLLDFLQHYKLMKIIIKSTGAQTSINEHPHKVSSCSSQYYWASVRFFVIIDSLQACNCYVTHCSLSEEPFFCFPRLACWLHSRFLVIDCNYTDIFLIFLFISFLTLI